MSTTTEAPRPHGLVNNFRWIVVILCALSYFVNYLDRAALSVALPFIDKELQIPEWLSGALLGAFFVSYAFTQLPVGRWIDKYAIRPIFVGGAVLWGAVTMAVGAVNSAMHLLILRFLLGLGESVNYPSAVKTTSLWFPVRERVFASSIWDNGSRFGSAFSLPIITGLLALVGWRGTFVIIGALALVWAMGFWAIYRDPGKGRGTEAELAYIRAGGARDEEAAKLAGEEAPAALRYRDLFRLKEVWAMMTGFFCLNYVIFFFITWFPSYLVNARHFDLLKLGVFGMIPGLVSIVGSFAGGAVSDWMVRKGFGVTRARKTCLVGGLLGSSVIVFAAFVDSSVAALVLLSVSYGCVAFAGCNVASLPQDMAPHPSQVSSIAGVQNAFANIAGFIGPTLTGILLTISGGSYVGPLAVSAIIAIVGACIYGFGIKEVAPIQIKGRVPEIESASTPA